MLRGRFAAHPSVWTWYLFCSFGLAFGLLVGLSLAYAQWATEITPWGLLSIPICLVLGGTLVLASQVGQRLGADQMHHLKGALRELTDEEPNVGRSFPPHWSGAHDPVSSTSMSPFIERTLAVAFGGAIGAVGRYWISGWISRITAQHPFPFGTLSVNLIGAFVLGLVMGATTSGRFLISPTVRVLLTIGCLGGLTTFSTFTYETLEALRAGDFRIAMANVGISVVAGLFAAWLGLNLGERI